MSFWKRLRVRVRRRFSPRPRGVGPKRVEKPWRRLNVKRVAISLGTFAVLSALVTPGQFFRRPRLTEGEIAKAGVTAPYKFAVEKDRVTLRRERDEVAARVLPVFRENPDIAGIAEDELGEFFVIIRQLADTYAAKTGREREAFVDELSIALSPDTLVFLLEAEPETLDLIRNRSSEVLAALFVDGILDAREIERRGLGKTLTLARGDGEGEEVASADEFLSPTTAGGRARALAAKDASLSEKEAAAVAEVAALKVRPNLLHDEGETERRRREAREAVNTVERWVEENEKIVERNKVVTRAQIRAVAALYSGRTVKNLAVSLGGRSLMVAIVLTVLGIFFLRYRPALAREPRYWWMLAVVLVVSCFVSRSLALLLINYSPLSVYIFAACLGAMLITLLVDAGFGFAVAITLATLSGVMAGVALRPAFMALAAAAVAVFLVARIRRRSDFYRVFVGIVLVTAAAAIGIGLVDMSPWRDVAEEIWWGTVLAAASVAILAVLLPLFEMTFDVVTDLKLLELADLNQPLLRKLLLEAPGTYHHSIVVGSLAEVAAGEAGANPLLARVAAYYHDIGKLRAPAYFAENTGSEGLKHEHLSPQMSSLVVASHTKQGAKMAEEAGLPPAIIDAIHEHHGTNLISFFYQEAIKLDEHKVLAEDDFRYPGPKPHGKVSAIVMLADAVESASRSLNEPTPTSIRSMAEKIVASRLAGGQLDECDLTLAEVHLVKESLIKALNSIFHIRPTYPENGEQYVVPYLSTHSAETKSN
ncbi:MAG TPA: HDIG domain-containing protein [bacterium]|nr:HDIG domain-containing protein [bacterium]